MSNSGFLLDTPMNELNYFFCGYMSGSLGVVGLGMASFCQNWKRNQASTYFCSQYPWSRGIMWFRVGGGYLDSSSAYAIVATGAESFLSLGFAT